MGRARLALAFLLSCSVPLMESLLGLELAEGSLAALALVPWLVLAPFPRAPDAGARRHLRAALRATVAPGCLAFLSTSLGAGLDRARGAPALPLAVACASAWIALVLWTLAAERARASGRDARRYAGLWLAWLPLALALELALAWVPLRAGAAEPPARPVLALDPLVACLRWGRAGGLAEVRPLEAALAVAGAALVLALVHVSGRSADPRSAA